MASRAPGRRPPLDPVYTPIDGTSRELPIGTGGAWGYAFRQRINGLADEANPLIRRPLLCRSPRLKSFAEVAAGLQPCRRRGRPEGFALRAQARRVCSYEIPILGKHFGRAVAHPLADGDHPTRIARIEYNRRHEGAHDSGSP